MQPLLVVTFCEIPRWPFYDPPKMRRAAYKITDHNTQINPGDGEVIMSVTIVTERSESVNGGECPACSGTGRDGKGNTCRLCGGSGK